ncbi:MAG: hypothetical protein NUV69_03120 [Candidatus Curtissbacteria bacterium]|nr:hypothetical protein [Candidatus Curtissbacteria bacterium]
MRKVLPAGRRGFIPAPVMIGLAVILLITAATIYVNSNLIRKAHEQPTDKSAVPVDVVMDVPANWITYTNTEYNFSLKYPPDLKVISPTNFSEKSNIVSFNNPSDETVNSKNILINVYPNPQNIPLEEFLETVFTQTGVDGKTPVISILKANLKQTQSPLPRSLVFVGTLGETPSKHVFSSQKGNVYEFILSSGIGSEIEYSAESEKIFDQMLSTFKFVE